MSLARGGSPSTGEGNARSNRARVTIYFSHLRAIALDSSRRVMTSSYDTIG